MPYCPYTDTEIPDAECSPEHIVPLSMGGVNGFEIPVCASFNSRVGSTIDGAMANSFFILNLRNQFLVKGHRKKHPVFVAKNAKGMESNRPLQVHLDRHGGFKVWNPIEKIETKKRIPENISFSVDIDPHLGIRFCAKVALSAGYFVYGELFRNNVKHSELRTLMNHSISELSEEEIYSFETLVDTDLQTENQPQVRVFRHICEAASPYSVVGLVPNSTRISVFVGVMGKYIGMLNTPAVTRSFPYKGNYELGHVLYMSPENGLTRMSFRRVINEVVIPCVRVHKNEN